MPTFPQTPNPTMVVRDANQELDRRMAPRLIEVVERLASKHEPVAALAARAIPVAQAYIDLYDASASSKAERRTEIESRDEGVADLHRTTRAWVGVMLGDVVGFNDDFDADSRVATDVIADAERLMGLVRTRTDSEGESLSYTELLLSSLGAKVQAAKAAATGAHRARVGTQEHLARLREAQTEFRKELVGARRVLRSLVGSSSLDYQRLRLTRVGIEPSETEAEDTDTSETIDATDEPSGMHDLPTDLDTAVNE